MAFVEFKDVKKVYHMGEVDIHALRDVNFEIEEGEFCVIVGASGAGKTTILNILGGMDTLSEGKVILDGKEISAYNQKQLTSYRRYDIGFVFQFYNLIQNLTALENVELASQISKNPLDAAETLKKVGLEERMSNFPAQLSGGEQQRVAIARAYAVQPEVLLMDEPFGALDAQTRTQLQSELTKTWQEEKKTCFFITHDVEEAVMLATKVIIMSARPGRIKKIVDINLPYPRTQEMKMELPFLDLKTYIWGEVYQEYLEVRK